MSADAPDDSYRGRRVFVTGHTGFKGAWLAEWLGDPGRRGHRLRARPAHGAEPVRGDRPWGRGSTTWSPTSATATAWLAEVQAAQPSVIFHLAAQPLVLRAYAEPHETFETNVMGTVNVLEAARACASVRAVVIVTSDKCYQNHEDGRALPRDGRHGRPRPVQRQQGLRRAGHGGLPRELLRRRGGGGIRPRRQRHRRRRLGRRPDHPRLRASPGRPASPSWCATPMPSVPGSTSSSRSSGYLWLGARMLREGRRYEGAWNFGPTDEAGDRSGALGGRSLP